MAKCSRSKNGVFSILATPAMNTENPKWGSLVSILNDDVNIYQQRIPINDPFEGQQLYIVISNSGFNRVTPFFYGLRIIPGKYDPNFLSEPVYQEFIDKEFNIMGIIDKMQIHTICPSHWAQITTISPQKMSKLQLDIKNIFNVN
ncbi:hypothetical protein [Levilactobacillus parabrevis]|uniref:hypothetical protein n=1 Tax=Levilactobacillus parabrevis TaxID=357278 RepID=UPI0021A4A49B|nr:hypothetical protein [Levilactobacillus parabrevis]MCT4487126.1 hypothetical protein [Levilactobacillus parabrevis]MCT4489830.1 hypothetical protein [Levilactobacillus parabrevis]